MKHLEPINGQDLKSRCDELRARGATLLSLQVGKKNSGWILEYFVEEKPEAKEEQGELL